MNFAACCETFELNLKYMLFKKELFNAMLCYEIDISKKQ